MQPGISERSWPVAVVGLSRHPASMPAAQAAWQALDDAGVIRARLDEIVLGVFGPTDADHLATELGARGPALTVDAVAAVLVHLAGQSLRAGEADLALVELVAADGSGGFLVLKPAAAAQDERDPVYCLLAGGVLGRDGLLRRALALAGVDQNGLDFLWWGDYRPAASGAPDETAGGDAATALLEIPVLLSRGQSPLAGREPDPARRMVAALVGEDPTRTGGALVLAQPSGPEPPASAGTDEIGALPVLLSAETEELLRGTAESLRRRLAEPEAPILLDTAYTLGVARTHRPHRAVLVVQERAELTEGLTELSGGQGGVELARPGRTVAFLFPGEGGQRPGMGRELYPRFPVFAAALDEVCAEMEAVSPWSVRELLLGDGAVGLAPADEALYTQDALFALQWALFRQLADWGVHPDYLAGHSVGELAAATAAGVFSLPDVCALLAERVRLFQTKMPVGGAMVAMRVSEAEARESLAGLEALVGISAVNAPNSVVISGDRDAVLRVAGLWSQRGRKTKQLPVDRAFHSPHVAGMAADFERFARELDTRPPRIPVVPVHDGLGTAPELVSRGEYWGAQLRGTGHFLNCVTRLDAAGVDTYLDMSANGVLAALVEETLPEATTGAALVTAALGGGRSDLRAVLGTVGELHAHGVEIDWTAVFAAWDGGRRVHLPTEAAPPAKVRPRPTDLVRLIRRESEAMIGDGFRADRPFFEQGLDSVRAVELVKRLRSRTGQKISVTALFEHPTPNELAAHLDHPAPAAPGPVRRRATRDEPIAILGMSCRFPGQVRSPEDLWQLVSDGRTTVGPMPEDRGWDLEALYDPSGRQPGKSYVRHGGFLHEATEFDAAFFGIGGREALEMDPQQRLLLELSWEAFERAGIDPTVLRGGDTGVFAGLSHGSYGVGPGYTGTGTREHLAIGSISSVASGRISYTFGLQGPNLAIDTACSSSLVALHLAAVALRRGECGLALAGGVTVMASPGVFVEFSRQGGLAPDALVKPFASAADGTAWAEGGGMFVLERLSDARANGHPVLAVIAGSAINSDGASNGLTAPNGAAQHRLVRSALADANLGPADVDVLEAHGTGTVLGDPIEADALVEAYGQHRPTQRPLLLGSVKSNLGHTQAAAGAAGVIKIVQAMRHGMVPATVNVDDPNPQVDWDRGLRLVTEATPWPENGRPRRGAVSSFGIGGANAHLIVAQPPSPATAPASPAASSVATPLVLSAHSSSALAGQAGRLAGHWDQHPELEARDIAFSLATTRASLAHRAVLTTDEPAGVRRALAALAGGRGDPELVEGTAVEGRLAFLLAGQGSQRLGMGRDLYRRHPVFAEAFDQVCAQLTTPVRTTMFGDDEQLPHRTEFAQPALFAFEVALFRLLESWDIRPDLLLGHSVGELAAAHLAGVLSLADAGALVCARGRLMQGLPEAGAMMALAVAEDELHPLPPGVSLAAVNGPRSVVISGREAALAPVAERVAAQGRKVTRLRVSHAFHSELMEPMLEEFRTVAEGLSYHRPEIPLVSGVTGRLADDDELCSAEYWVRHVVAPVRFHDGMVALREAGATTFLELGPGVTLTEMASAGLDDDGDAAVIPSLRRPAGEPADAAWEAQALLRAVAVLHVRGHGPDWSAWYAGSGARRVELPTYAFQRKRFWLMPDAAPTQPEDEPGEVFWDAVHAQDLDRLSELLGASVEQRFSQLLPALARWRHTHDQQTRIDRLRYRISWQPVPDPDPTPGNWLIVHWRDHPVPAPLREVFTGRTLAVDPPAELPGDAGRAQLAERLRLMIAAEPVDGVLSMLALGADPLPGAELVPAGLALTMALVQAIGDAELDLTLWCATRGAVATGQGERLDNPDQAMVWGFGRVAALEHPGRWGGLVDLPAELDPAAAQRLAGLLRSTENQVAVRANGLFARRLVRAPAPPDAVRRSWPLHGTTLITGAFGALGRRLARWLAGQGAQRLLLTGRHVDDPALVAELAGLGAEVDVARCDVSERRSLAALLDRIPADRPLTAVAHAAGVLDDGVITALDPTRLARALRGKVDGAMALHELTGPLQAFVLFSSASGAVGNAGQANYASANAYLDALAEQRRADGLEATCVAWGPWGCAGMAVDGADAEVVAARLRRGGMSVLEPDVALAALDGAYAFADSGLVIADVDWAQLTRSRASTDPLLTGLVQASANGLVTPVTELSPLIAQLTGMSEGERTRALRELVAQHTAQVLGHDSTTQIQPGKPFHEQGLTSLGVVELRNQIGAATGTAVAATVLYDYPTPIALAGYLDTRLAPPPAEGSGPEPAPDQRRKVAPGGADGDLAGDGLEVTDLDAVLELAERELARPAEGHRNG